MILSEKIINTNEFGGTVDIITGIEDFESKVTFDEFWHCYKLGDKILPSVTRLLDNGEYVDVDPEILEYACEKGKIIHKEIEDYLKQGKFGFTKEFYDFLDIYIGEVEKFSNKAIFDIKTYSQVTPSKREKCYKQCKMYSEGVKHLTGIEIKQFYMIWLPNKNKGKLIDLTKEFGGENGKIN